MDKRQQNCIGIMVITMMLATLIIVFGIQLHHLFVQRSPNKGIEYFERQHRTIFLKEQYQNLGGHHDLSAKEMLVNNRIVNEKYIDRDYFDDPDIMRSRRKYNVPAINSSSLVGYGKEFFEKVQKRPLFKLLQSMPKGAALHVKDFAMCSGDCLLELTYSKSLWICINNMQDVLDLQQSHKHESQYEYEFLQFSNEHPTEFDDLNSGSDCKWVLLSDLRLQESNSVVDQKLREHFTFRKGKLQCNYQHFTKFIHGLLTYEPIWYTYIQNSFKEFLADNVQYVEIVSTLPKLYNLQRRNFTYLDTALRILEATKNFSAQNPKFFGAMLIYQPPSNDATDKDLTKFFERALELKRNFKSFFAGINLANNFQSIGRLYFLSHKLIDLNDEFKFYYLVDDIHGNYVDENLIDSVLLGSKRMTYNSAIMRHPELLHLVRRNNIAVEISPTTIINGMPINTSISKLCDHPSTLLFSAGYPIVITSEYSNFFNSKPLTHDFYLAFVGINSKKATLGTLKQLAMNSLHLSSSRLSQKRKFFDKWLIMWDDWIDQIANQL